MVDLETVAIVALTVQGANQGDTTTLTKTLIEVAETIEQVMPEKEMTQVVVDKGMHSIQRIVYLRELGVRDTFANRTQSAVSGRETAKP